MSSSSEYLYRDQSGREIGPLSLDTLVKLHLAGVLDPQTAVRTAGSPEWKRLAEVLTEEQLLSRAAPPEPTARFLSLPAKWTAAALLAIAVVAALWFFRHGAGSVSEIEGNSSKVPSKGRTPSTAGVKRDPAREYQVGLTHYSGTAGRVDWTEAVSCFARAAAAGHVKAQYLLGVAYQHGMGTRRDPGEAASCFTNARGALVTLAEGGDAEAQLFCGAMWDNGLGVSKDVVQAAKWYRQAAEQGDPYAQCALGDKYLAGEGVPKDAPAAREWFLKAWKGLEKAGGQGDALAQEKLGHLFLSGVGVPRDDSAAFEWLRKAAERGAPWAAYLLGSFASDDVERANWYLKAADGGLAEAQATLASMCERGIGVTQSVGKAFFWYQKASANGHQSAAQQLDGASDTAQFAEWVAARQSEECLRSLVQVGVAFRLYATDNGAFPFHISTNEAGPKSCVELMRTASTRRPWRTLRSFQTNSLRRAPLSAGQTRRIVALAHFGSSRPRM